MDTEQVSDVIKKIVELEKIARDLVQSKHMIKRYVDIVTSDNDILYPAYFHNMVLNNYKFTYTLSLRKLTDNIDKGDNHAKINFSIQTVINQTVLLDNISRETKVELLDLKDKICSNSSQIKTLGNNFAHINDEQVQIIKTSYADRVLDLIIEALDIIKVALHYQKSGLKDYKLNPEWEIIFLKPWVNSAAVFTTP